MCDDLLRFCNLLFKLLSNILLFKFDSTVWYRYNTIKNKLFMIISRIDFEMLNFLLFNTLFLGVTLVTP